MDTIELEARTKLAINLGDMAALMIKREPPFDTIQPPVEATPYFYRKYWEYYDEIDASMKKSILSMLIQSSRDDIKRQAGVSEKTSFHSRFPQHVETSDNFMAWITEKEGPKKKQMLSVPYTPPIKVAKVIKSIMKDRFGDFRYDTSGGLRGMLAFSKPISINNKVFITPDTCRVAL